MSTEFDDAMLKFLKALKAVSIHPEQFSETERAAIVEVLCYACMSSSAMVAIRAAQIAIVLVSLNTDGE